MKNIIIDNKEYCVIEKLPYHGIGMSTVIVETKTGEKVAVKQSGRWIYLNRKKYKKKYM